MALKFSCFDLLRPNHIWVLKSGRGLSTVVFTLDACLRVRPQRPLKQCYAYPVLCILSSVGRLYSCVPTYRSNAFLHGPEQRTD